MAVVCTNLAASVWGQAHVAGSTIPEPSYFKYGEGGWVMTGSTKVPRAPDVTLTDMDAISNPSRYPADSRYTFQKSFSGSDVSYDAGTLTVTCRCFLDTSEANADALGNSPEFWELGIFDVDDNLIFYATFQGETKDGTRQLDHSIKYRLGGG